MRESSFVARSSYLFQPEAGDRCVALVSIGASDARTWQVSSVPRSPKRCCSVAGSNGPAKGVYCRSPPADSPDYASASASSSNPSSALIATRPQLLQRPEKVLPKDLSNQLRTERAIEHALHEPRQLQTRAHVLRRDDQPVPITSECRHVRPHSVHDVLEMSHHVGCRSA